MYDMAQRNARRELDCRKQRGVSIIVYRGSVLGVTARQERLGRFCH